MKIFFFLIAIFFLNSCSFKKIGAEAGEGLATESDTIGHNVVHGAVTELTDSASQHKLQRLVDSIATALGDRLINKASVISDSVFKKKILIWADSLVEALTGKKTQLNVAAIQAAFFDKTTTDIAHIKKMILDLIDQITSVHTKNKLDSLVDEVIGEKTNLKLVRLADSVVSHLVDTAFAKIDRDYKAGIGNSLHRDTDFIRDNARMLLVILAAIAAVIIFLVWWSRRKYLHLTTILTKNIDNIPDQSVYNNVTRNIKSDAMTAGLESQLRDLLNDNGLLHSKTRRS